MTSFYELPFFSRSLFGLWAFLLCCEGIIGAILSVAFRKYQYILFSLLSFAPAYFLWQVIFNIYRVIKNNPVIIPAEVSLWLGKFPWLVWLAVFLPITLAASGSILLNIRYSRTYISPLSIKICGDGLTCGICYWFDNGRVVLSNICMNRLCLALTGEPLLSGTLFRAAVSEDGYQAIGNKVWIFTCRDLELNGRHLQEMIARDVTEIHAKTQELQRNNEELSRMTETLKAYTLKIDDVVRRQEILQAKVNIHDEMNRLMLTTVTADREDTGTLDDIFNRWQQNALLLCREAEGKEGQNTSDKLTQFAELLGLTLQQNGTLPDTLTEKQKELFYTAAQEAIVNVVKHGEAKKLELSFEESKTGIRCIFENDGNIPKGNIRFTGGLANLSILAREQDASLSAEAGETFRLFLFFPSKK